jgi:tripeptide aminopeptidase
MDEYGYVTATIAATSDKPNVPVIGFIAHMDTSPEVSGADVKPILHANYDGGDIVLPADPSIVITVADNPDLAGKQGETIITADGTTLLGADNKCGIAEIFDAAAYFVTHPEVKHGVIRICITPDEEVGQGTKYFKIAADFIAALPKEGLSPETTADKEGYVHPYVLTGGIEETSVKFLLRSFEVDELRTQEAMLRALADETVAKYPKSSFEVKVDESYRNMRFVLDEHPHVIEHAKEAIRRAGVEPHLGSIRGGTDGARLSYMGLPCPNIFAGEHSFHSKREWVSVEDMKKAVATIIHLACIWEEKA